MRAAYTSKDLKVTRKEAANDSREIAKRLTAESRLALILDLDHTLLHATGACLSLSRSPSPSFESMEMTVRVRGDDLFSVCMGVRARMCNYTIRVHRGDSSDPWKA